MYYSVFSLIYASWNFDGDTPTTRRTDGTPVDLEGIKDATLVKMKEISPDAGDIESLRDFVINFSSLYENFLGYNGFFNSTLSLYDMLGDPAVVPEIVKSNDSITISSNPFIVNNVLVDTDLSIVNPTTDDLETQVITVLRESRPRKSIEFGALEEMIREYIESTDYRVTVRTNVSYKGNTSTHTAERVKSFKAFFNDNLMSDTPGNSGTNDYYEQQRADQLAEIIFPIYSSLYQTLYDLIDDDLKTYDDGRTQADDNTDTDGITPEEQWIAKWSIIESNFEELQAQICDRRRFEKTGFHKEGDDAGLNVKKFIYHFNVLPEDIGKLFGTLLYNYYVYKYNIQEARLDPSFSLKDFMNIILPGTDEIS